MILAADGRDAGRWLCYMVTDPKLLLQQLQRDRSSLVNCRKL
jgi:hypothetical protein